MSGKKTKGKFYDCANIIKACPIAQYYMVFGERSNGKTFNRLKKAVEMYLLTGKRTAYIRRWKEDMRGQRARQLCGTLVCDGNKENQIEKLSNGEWTDVLYDNHAWYLAKWDEDLNKLVPDHDPFMFWFALNDMEHDKSITYTNLYQIVFDEFLTRRGYVGSDSDEFVLFMNVISTLVRHNNDIQIWMLGNTVNKDSIYFKEMGLKHVREMKPGDIDVYEYPVLDHDDMMLRVAVEYADSPSKEGKPSDVYFAFDNAQSRLAMITGGAWEMNVYPHLPYKYQRKDVLFVYFIRYGGDTLQCEVIQHGSDMFTYVYPKTTPIQNEDKTLIYDTEHHAGVNYGRRINDPANDMQRRVWYFFKADKVFYSTNEEGEIMRNYLLWCNAVDMCA
jgi:hypothetical protein